ncbi:hypothetical protein OG909_28915 [Streptomyces sp. NBC_01754]|uniref:hypothetical protein n=1 Tax=Streptomyces sp. NBC_01754 TaxID=2975930 RepID=UPI002DD950A5|nr:hypothetical protein [Streptomyces sp. NBC_01754]WSC95985.1 hypothetical protein OG909_28915 [Streptomyces sp. NBC_01754]
MSLRPTLRTAALAAVAMGAVLLPSATAVADSSPTPAPPVDGSATPVPDTQRGEATEAPSLVPAESSPAGTMPRGGVDAGERPADTTGTTALYGSAAGVALLAGAGTLVVRRRSAAQRNG